MQQLPPAQTTLAGEPGLPINLVTWPFAEGVKVDITITGNIFLTPHPLAAPIKYNGELDYLGIRLPNDNGCLLQATVVFSQVSGAGNPFPTATACTTPRTMTNYSVRALVGGTGTVSRSAKPVGNSYPCDSIRSAGSQCYTVTGSQTVTVTPLPAQLDFRGSYNWKRSHGIFVPPFVNASGATIDANYYAPVWFSDSTFARGMPLKNNAHYWTFGDPSDLGDPRFHKTENTCYAGLLLCQVNIKEAGTMLSDTRVNGTYQTDEVTIYCSDTMAILNADLVRQGLMSVNDSSGYPSKPLFSDRAERKFLILQDSVTPGAEPYLWYFPKSASADVCSVGDLYLTWSSRPANTRVLAAGHAHDADEGDTVICHDVNTGAPYITTVDPGASRQDWMWLRLANAPGLNPGTVLPLKEYIVKGNEVFVMDLSKGPGSELKPGGSFRWPVKGRCIWPKRSTYHPETQ